MTCELKKIPYFQINSFTDVSFAGNPAGVCPLSEWLSDNLLQSIACENNLSETAYFVKYKDGFQIRWFTPKVEVDLCGHATLAAAWVIFEKLFYTQNEIKFYSRSGQLIVTRFANEIVMNFPARKSEKITMPNKLDEVMGIPGKVLEAWKSDDLILLVDNPVIIEKLNPDFSKLINYQTRGTLVTSIDNKYDFVSRWFGPQVGVNEDPVTGSAHCSLIPFWAEKLGKKEFKAMQGGKRQGQLSCKLISDDRVEISGRAFLYMEGSLIITDD